VTIAIATADAVELAEWTNNPMGAIPENLSPMTSERRWASEGIASTARSDRDDPDDAEDFRASFAQARARGSAVDGGSVLTNTTTGPGQLLVKISRH
jgi:hypothetical protein